MKDAAADECYGQRMMVYKLRLFGASDRIVALQDLSAATDNEALSIVRGMFKGSSPVVTFDP